MEINFNFNLNTLLKFLIILFVIFCVYKLNKKYETFISLRRAQNNKVFSNENYVNDRGMYLAFPTKCFSCEKDLVSRGINLQWGNRTKSFDSEHQIGGANPLRDLGQKTKNLVNNTPNGGYSFKMHQ